MLLDEPLVNLDYKLREELREELAQLFAAGDSTVVYATTEPTEALLLGGYTAVLDAGELLQYGPTAEVFHQPKSIRVARAFSDPPMNLVAGARRAPEASRFRDGRASASAGARRRPDPALTVGVRAERAARAAPRPGDVAIAGRGRARRNLRLRHLRARRRRPIGELVAQLTGVHRFDARARRSRCYLAAAQVVCVRRDAASSLLAPERRHAERAH